MRHEDSAGAAERGHRIGVSGSQLRGMEHAGVWLAVVLLLAFVVSTVPVLRPPRAPGLGAKVATAAQDPSAVEAELGLDRPTRRLFFATPTVEEVTACIAARDGRISDALPSAAEFSENSSVVEALLAAGADLTPLNMLQRLADAGLLKGKTVGIDATTLEANAALRSIVRRDTGEGYEAFLRGLAVASGIPTPTRAELARLDRKRPKKGSNDDWTHPQDPDAKITTMKDGRTHLAHKAEQPAFLTPQIGGYATGC